MMSPINSSVTPKAAPNATSSPMKIVTEIGFGGNKMPLQPSKAVMDHIDDWAKQQLLDSSGGSLVSLQGLIYFINL